MKKKKPISIEALDFNIVAEEEDARGRPEQDAPFRVAILGDFSGRTNRGLFEMGPGLANRRLLRVDRDNLDGLLKKIGAEIHLPVAGKGNPPVVVRFTELDSFHPDRLYEEVNAFRGLVNARQKLGAPRSLPKAPIEERGAEPKMPGFTSGSILDQIIDETAPGPSGKRESSEPSEWDAFLKKIVDPYAIPAASPKEADLTASVEAVTAKLMRGILHFPDFQALEAAWRGVSFVISRLDTDSEIEIYLLDISKAELATDLSGKENLESTGLYRLLLEQPADTFGPNPWAVIAGNYTFDHNEEDVELLERIGRIAEKAGVPFISCASPRLLGCESLADTPDPDDWQQPGGGEAGRAWQRLRKRPEAACLGLALPRFLLRLPYGANTDPVEAFPFEEMLSVRRHDDYLWGNPCFACVYLLAEAFNQHGWGFRPGRVQEIGDLPLHVYKEEGESKMEPCAEAFLSQRAAEIILDKGFMPLLSFRDRDAIRLARFQSIADPLTALAGRWGR
jgi:type VI secretion system protein ImpC